MIAAIAVSTALAPAVGAFLTFGFYADARAWLLAKFRG